VCGLIPGSGGMGWRLNTELEGRGLRGVRLPGGNARSRMIAIAWTTLCGNANQKIYVHIAKEKIF